MCGRVNVHCNGNSGGRPLITEKLIQCLNAGITPVCAEIGSVGAWGFKPYESNGNDINGGR